MRRADKKGDKKVVDNSAKPIPEREQKMLAAFDIYINYIKDPKDEELVGMKFLKANIYRRYNHYDEAIPIFHGHPRAPQASTRPRSTRPTCCSTPTTARRTTKGMLELVNKLDA